MAVKDYYSILGVKKDATADQIKKAYRKQARKYHPDVNPGNKQAEDKFKEISEAHDVLADSEKRKIFDEFGDDGLKAGFDPEQARQFRQWQQTGGFASGGGGGGARFNWSPYSSDQEEIKYSGFEDIFGDLFGRSAPGAAGPKKGRDVEVTLEVDFLTAIKGGTRRVTLQKHESCKRCSGTGRVSTGTDQTCKTCKGTGQIRVAQGPLNFNQTCPDCGGTGRPGERCPECGGTGQQPGSETIDVGIPAGVHDGSRIRLAKKGEPGVMGGSPGDLYIITKVSHHPVFKRDGDDLRLDLPVTIREALEGGEVSVPTPSGMVQLKIPSGIRSGKSLRLKGKGVPNLKTKAPGDMFVTIKVQIPATADPEALNAAKVLERFYEGDLRKDIRL